jgi:putative acetyltransferase
MTDTFLIRPITSADDAAMAAVIRTVMPEFGADGPGFAIHDAEVDTLSSAYAAPRSAYFVVERDGRVIGGGGVAPLESAAPEVCELRKMYFLPEARGIGFRRCYLETLTGMDAAQTLYRRSGFTPLCAPMGGTGHHGCDRYFIRDL